MKCSQTKKLFGCILGASALAYPVLIYFFGSQLPSSYWVFGLIAVLLLRSIFHYRSHGAHNLYMTFVVATTLLGLFLLNDRLALHLYPVLMSLSFAFLLGWTLLYPPSLIERFARIMEPDLDPEGVLYTRKVTVVWLGFSLLNASISFMTLWWGDEKLWLLYNGFISYLLMGLLMGGEYLFRGYFKAKRGYRFIPAHLLMTLKEDQAWSRYWNSTEFASFSHYVGALSAKIRAAKAKRVFVISDDRAYFLAGFLATLHAEVPVVLPQSTSVELLKTLLEPQDVLLTDEVHLISAVTGSIAMAISYDCTAPLKFTPLNPKESVVLFYTSGSTGKPKVVEKKLRQLEAEVEVLHRLWGQLPQGKFLSTVSHHHLYAFLYSLLWPVCSGFPLERRTFTYWGDLLAKSSKADFLISSPSHLGRFSTLEECPPQTFRSVFSSGAPLSYEAAVQSKHHLGVLPLEVYGSTETGGVAFRQQERPETPWQRFDCIELSSDEDHKLRVKSPYIDGNGFYQTEDLVTWEEGDKFHLQGRADRIVKIEGKRISLAEIEDNLCKSGLIVDAAVLVLERSYRDELGAVLVLSKLGCDALKTQGQMAFIRQLRATLSLYFHGVLIPRKWRFVEAIPVNHQGKRELQRLKGYFVNGEKPLHRPLLGAVRHPTILKKESSENKIVYSLQIPPDLAYFEGHFKERPVVPGVVQLHWAIDYAKVDLELQGAVLLCEQIKFTHLMSPLDEITLVLEYHPEKSFVTYSFKGHECAYSSGRFTLSRGAPHEL